MIPLGDVIPSRTRPVVTMALLAVQAVAFAAAIWPDASPSWPPLTSSPGVLLVLSAFLIHPPPVGALANLAAVWVFGPTLEDRLGSGRFAALYLLCGTVAAAAHRIGPFFDAALAPGISGAVAGLVCGYLVRYHASSVVVLVPLFVTMRIVEIPALVCGAIWMLLQTSAGLAALAGEAVRTPIDIVAYGAGALTGGAGAVLLRRRDRERVEWWNDRPLTR